jgi:hypothetical protein
LGKTLHLKQTVYPASAGVCKPITAIKDANVQRVSSSTSAHLHQQQQQGLLSTTNTPRQMSLVLVPHRGGVKQLIRQQGTGGKKSTMQPLDETPAWGLPVVMQCKGQPSSARPVTALITKPHRPGTVKVPGAPGACSITKAIVPPSSRIRAERPSSAAACHGNAAGTGFELLSGSKQQLMQRPSTAAEQHQAGTASVAARQLRPGSAAAAKVLRSLRYQQAGGAAPPSAPSTSGAERRVRQFVSTLLQQEEQQEQLLQQPQQTPGHDVSSSEWQKRGDNLQLVQVSRLPTAVCCSSDISSHDVMCSQAASAEGNLLLALDRIEQAAADGVAECLERYQLLNSVRDEAEGIDIVEGPKTFENENNQGNLIKLMYPACGQSIGIPCV